MTTDDEYLVYTGHHNTTFYFKNKKLHREAGPAIICRKDNNKKKFEGLKDESLYTRVFEPIEQNEEMLFHVIYCDSNYYLDGVRYPTANEMHKARTEKAKNELAEELSANETVKIPKKIKI
jgi:hypothetical protein